MDVAGARQRSPTDGVLVEPVGGRAKRRLEPPHTVAFSALSTRLNNDIQRDRSQNLSLSVFPNSPTGLPGNNPSEARKKATYCVRIMPFPQWAQVDIARTRCESTLFGWNSGLVTFVGGTDLLGSQVAPSAHHSVHGST